MQLLPHRLSIQSSLSSIQFSIESLLSTNKSVGSFTPFALRVFYYGLACTDLVQAECCTPFER